MKNHDYSRWKYNVKRKREEKTGMIKKERERVKNEREKKSKTLLAYYRDTLQTTRWVGKCTKTPRIMI